MLCVMEGEDGTRDATTEFIATGRTGRRNAMPDILSSHGATSTAELPDALEKLSCSDSGGPSGAVGGSSGGSNGGAEGGDAQSSGS